MRETIQNANGKQFHAVSLSGGKDSTAMLLLMIERDMPINTGTSADRGRKSPVPQGFFHAESQGAETFYPQARKQRLSAENCPCAGCVFFCAGALFFLKGDYHG